MEGLPPSVELVARGGKLRILRRVSPFVAFEMVQNNVRLCNNTRED
jgi:hypothetical protein